MEDEILKKTQEREVIDGERFAFGANWARFLNVLNEDRIGQAVVGIKDRLEVESLACKSFLDIGSGSGLFSLAARRLGARVLSFDYDPQSVACTRELKRRYFESDDEWVIELGSVLDNDYLRRLGKFDVVYSWGVLHHTGDMWSALANVDQCVKPNGVLFLALYNDQGNTSKRWHVAKKIYNRLPGIVRPLFAVIALAPRQIYSFLKLLIQLKPYAYFQSIWDYKKNRGMSWWRDQIDWIGGYPFEVARPEQVFEFYRKRGYSLIGLKTCGGDLGCNEFVFQKTGGHTFSSDMPHPVEA